MKITAKAEPGKRRLARKLFLWGEFARPAVSPEEHRQKGVKGEIIQQAQWRSQAFELVLGWELSSLRVLEDVTQCLRDSALNGTAKQGVAKPGF